MSIRRERSPTRNMVRKGADLLVEGRVDLLVVARAARVEDLVEDLAVPRVDLLVEAPAALRDNLVNRETSHRKAPISSWPTN